MGNIEEVIKIVNEYDEKLAILFKRVIDAAIKEATEKQMNPLDKYLYVDSKIEYTYKEIAYAQGLISNPNIMGEIKPPVTDVLMERIYRYTNPLVNGATEYIKQQFNIVMNSKNLGELMQRFEAFKTMLEEKQVQSFLYEDIDVSKRV